MSWGNGRRGSGKWAGGQGCEGGGKEDGRVGGRLKAFGVDELL